MMRFLHSAPESSCRSRRIVGAFALLLAALMLVTATVASPAALAQEDGSSGGGEETSEAPASGEDEGSGSGDDEGSGSTEEEGPEEGGEDSGGAEKDSSNTADESIDKPTGLGGIAIDFLKAIVGYVWDWSFTWFGERVGSGLIGAMLTLPDPTGSSGLGQTYDSVTKLLSPLLLLGVLVMSLLMMLKAHNRGISHAGLNFLPRMLGVAIVLGSLPFLMSQLSTLGQDLTISLMPNGSEIATAGKEMLKAILGQLVVGNIMNLVLAIAGTYVLFVVAVVTFFKNIFYILLFIAAPFPLLASLVPGLSNFASAWAKAVLVCAAIPAMWAAELWLGTKLIADPWQVFGEGADALGFITNGMFTSIIAIIIMWIMYKTPFKVLSWAFVSYDPHHGGGIGSFGKWMMFAAGKQAIGQIAGAASNMKGGGGDGGPAPTGGSGRAPGAPTGELGNTGSPNMLNRGRVNNASIQNEGNSAMSIDHGPNTANALPPPNHGPTDSDATPYSLAGRGGPQGENPSPNFDYSRTKKGDLEVFDSRGNMLFRPKDGKEDY